MDSQKNNNNETVVLGKNTPEGNDATIVKPKQPQKPSDSTVVKSSPAKTPVAPSNAPTLATAKREKALTQLHDKLKGSNESTQGFAKAKKVANAALAANKIILNKRFVLESVVGVGGMGTVYVAKDLRKIEADDPNPKVAVKVLNDTFKNHPNAFVTLQREASRSHTLSHPNIVTVHDFDRDGDVIFMTMEYLEGEPLDDLVHNNPKGLPLAKALPLIKGICSALMHAHAKGFIHSDLKPGNVFVTKDGEAKILDFGIARSVSHQANDFDAGSLGALTPAYATLEMFEGKEPSPADDIYALGIIIYQILSGKHPYKGLSIQEAKAKQQKPLRLPELSKEQWRALEQTLAFDKAERTAAIQDFYKAFTFTKRFPFFKVTTALLVLGIIAGVAWVSTQTNEIDEAIAHTFAKANQCFDNKDFQCAIDSYQAVLELDNDHPEAKKHLQQAQYQLHESIANTIAEQIDQCLAKEDIACTQDQIARLKAHSPKHDHIEKALSAIKQIETSATLEQLVAQANACKQAGDWDCVAQQANAILAYDITHAEGLALKAIAEEQHQAAAAAQAERSQKIAQLLAAAEKCLAAKDYGCAISKSQSLLKIDQTNIEAIKIEQAATNARKVQQDNLNRVNSLMAKANECFEKKNYTCAISRSESALEIMPNHAKAKALITQSKNSINQLKNSININ